MTFSYSLEAVANSSELYATNLDGGQCVRPETEQVVFATACVGLDEIKPDNVDEWAFRLRFLQKLGYMNSFLTRTDIERHVGLRTNARTETRAQFLKWVLNRLESEVTSELGSRKVAVKSGTSTLPMRISSARQDAATY